MKIQVEHFFDERTSTLTYIVYSPETQDAVVIDPVLDYDHASGQVWDESIQLVLQFVESQKLKVHLIIETHAHADHLSSSYFLKKIWPAAKVGIGRRIIEVQKIFKKVFDLPELKDDGSQFDLLFDDQREYLAGQMKFIALSTPGHTPACMSFVIGEHVFTGDLIFMPDSGTGRCDFPAGDARTLFQSVTKKIYTLPIQTKIYVGHDYQPHGRELQYVTTVGEQKEKNIHIKANTTESDFVHFRTARDKTLSAPKLLLPSIQVNIDAGRLPSPTPSGVRYLKTPLKIMPNKHLTL